LVHRSTLKQYPAADPRIKHIAVGARKHNDARFLNCLSHVLGEADGRCGRQVRVDSGALVSSALLEISEF
jgi:hypothetical protein